MWHCSRGRHHDWWSYSDEVACSDGVEGVGGSGEIVYVGWASTVDGGGGLKLGSTGGSDVICIDVLQRVGVGQGCQSSTLLF